MTPVSIRMLAAGNSIWVPLNRLQISFAIGLGVVLSSGASLTYTVQHTFDSLWDYDKPPAGNRAVSIARSGTVATVTDPLHGLSAADSVLITGTSNSNFDSPNIGQVVASVPDANTYTFACANSGPTAASFANAKGLRVFNHASLAALTARSDGNYAFNVSAIRLNVSIYSSGFADLLIQQGMGR